jgi:hypothetical protein
LEGQFVKPRFLIALPLGLVTFTGVDGSEWDIDVQVATEPN